MSIFVVAGMVETIGFGQLGAFTPLYLQRQLHVAAADVPRLTGILASLSFVIGLPLAPFWGVWADKYSRKLIIVRSAAVEALLFGAVGLSHSVWQFALARAAVGFVLGNSGVMLAAQSSVTPRNRLGLAMGLVGGGGALGIAVGPVLGGLLLGRTGFTTLFLIDAALSALSAALIVAVYHEDPWRPRSAEPVGRMVRDAARDIVLVPWVRALFAAYFVLLFSIFVLRPFVPIFIAQLYSAGTHFGTLPTAIGLIVTLGALAQGVFAAFWGRLGDAVGFYKIGMELIYGGDGLALARRLIGDGRQVFVDLKLHDIPNTVERATAQIAKLSGE